MASSKKPVNPFYVILALVGIAFFITASAYGVMTVKQLHGQRPQDERAAGQRLLHILDEHGFAILLGEVAALGLVTFAAIGTDEFWSRRALRQTVRLAENNEESLPSEQESQATRKAT